MGGSPEPRVADFYRSVQVVGRPAIGLSCSLALRQWPYDTIHVAGMACFHA